MKYFKILLITLFISNLGFSQSTEGVVNYTITHNWVKKLKPYNYLSKIKREKYEYQYMSNAEWKMKTILYFNDSESRYIDSDEKTEIEEKYGFAGKKEKYEIRKNYKQKTQNDVIELLGKVYLIEDSLTSQSWKIKNDIKEVAGHICMNAVREDTLKMQKITAWFALDIPIPAGPERNYGLPGLILEVDVNDGGMLIEATSISFKKLTNEMDYPKKLKAKKINEDAFQTLTTNHIKDKKKAEEPLYYGFPYMHPY
ncbi:MAG: GLPGLI family protein [Bacteroidota bacterium]